MAAMEGFIYQALIMNVVCHGEITVLISPLPMDIKFKLKRQIVHLEINWFTDYIHKIVPKLFQLVDHLYPL